MGEWKPGPAWLFCPADRLERYAKALTRADQVVLDLEDAVAAANKAKARVAIAELATAGELDVERTVLRINASSSSEHQADLELIAQTGIVRAMLAKSEWPEDLAAVGCDVVALCESPVGVELAFHLAAVPNVVAVMWGADDLVAGLGGTSSRRLDGRYRDVARYARSRCLMAAKANGRLAVDNVYMDLSDHIGLASEAEDAAAVGFDVKVAIHPAQLPVIRAAFSPTQERIAWAQRLLKAAELYQGVFTFEGQMVDGPIFAQAHRIIAAAANFATAD